MSKINKILRIFKSNMNPEVNRHGNTEIHEIEIESAKLLASHTARLY
ncbi:MAG: hypothetical protein JW750_02755 [Anaerolineaceae bacterium]|nr:hypothetical protein [Anaerolineaceae bacterium]